MKKFMVFFVVFINFLLIPTVTFAMPYWPTFQYNFQRTGENPYNTSQNKGTLKWKYRVFGRGTLAIGSDGTIYVGTNDYYLYAINPNGTLKWKYNLGGPVNLDGPTIGNDGTIYINGYYGYNRGCLNAINPDGTLKWQYPLGYDPNIVPAIGSDGTIYTGYTDSSYSYFGLVAINPNGTLKWIFKTDFRIVSSISIDSNGTIYFVTGNGTLYAVNSNGVLKWSFYLNYYVNSLPASTPTIGIDGTIYVGSDDKNLYAINPNGTLKWKCLTGDYVRSTPTIGNDGTIYIGDSDKYLYAINPDGTIKWKYLTNYPGLYASTVTIDSNGLIYYAPSSGLYALNPDGTRRWYYQTNGYFYTPIVIGSDGTLYGVADNGQYLYAIGNPSYNVNFVVKDPKGNAISDATININGLQLTTDSNGQSTIQLPNGSYGYTVSYSGYQNATGNITVNGSNLTINVTLNPQTYNVNFVIKDPKGNAISNATISINGSTLTTDSNGQSTIQLPNGSYGYTVSSSGYQNTTGNITVNGSSLTINVTLNPQTYNVNFVVKDPKGNAISNATISINGSTLTTDSSGQATIQLPNGTYSYTVSNSGYQNTEGSITINGSDSTISVTLYPQTLNLINNVSLDSSTNTYAAGQAIRLNVTTTGPVYRVTAQMWYSSNEYSSTGITDLVGGNGSWHTRQSSSEGYDTVVIIPKNTPDGTHNITITAYARYSDGTENIQSITIPITVKGTIYDYYHSEIIN